MTFGPTLMRWCQLLPSISTLLADVNRIDSTRLAWMNVNETEIYAILRGNIALLVFHGDVLIEFLTARIFESILGTDAAQRLRKLFPSLRELSESLAILRDTKTAWTTSFIQRLTYFPELRQSLGLPALGMTGTKTYKAASPPNALILSEDKICKLTVAKIHEQLDQHRALWKPGMTVLPRNYRLKNKATKLSALRAAIAEHLGNKREDSDMDGDTLVPSSRRQSAQMLDFDELEQQGEGTRELCTNSNAQADTRFGVGAAIRDSIGSTEGTVEKLPVWAVFKELPVTWITGNPAGSEILRRFSQKRDVIPSYLAWFHPNPRRTDRVTDRTLGTANGCNCKLLQIVINMELLQTPIAGLAMEHQSDITTDGNLHWSTAEHNPRYRVGYTVAPIYPELIASAVNL
ncbi:hypothetical protein B0H11DRAFT_1910470 [Mycena galericulata]|nr:hypothetical protein B0H11DRAFT_1910470 [Mycena galericulata]